MGEEKKQLLMKKKQKRLPSGSLIILHYDFFITLCVRIVVSDFS